jgi:hypothetical protein
VRRDLFLDFLTFDGRTDKLSWNFEKELPLHRCLIFPKSADLNMTDKQELQAETKIL